MGTLSRYSTAGMFGECFPSISPCRRLLLNEKVQPPPETFFLPGITLCLSPAAPLLSRFNAFPFSNFPLNNSTTQDLPFCPRRTFPSQLNSTQLNAT